MISLPSMPAVPHVPLQTHAPWVDRGKQLYQLTAWQRNEVFAKSQYRSYEIATSTNAKFF